MAGGRRLLDHEAAEAGSDLPGTPPQEVHTEADSEGLRRAFPTGEVLANHGPVVPEAYAALNHNPTASNLRIYPIAFM